jgi:uncharacterized membrane protein YjgN (DUF898 family)
MDAEAPSPAFAVIAFLLWVALGMSVLAAFAYYRAGLTNLIWNNVSLGDHRFSSTLRPWRLVSIYLTNLVAIAATVGLAIPWTRVRLASYRADHLTILPAGPLDAFAASQSGQLSATGSELVDVSGIDLGI